MEHKGEGYQGIWAIEVLHLRMKIQEVTYDYWEKWKKKHFCIFQNDLTDLNSIINQKVGILYKKFHFS